jgi:hypothetical protein
MAMAGLLRPRSDGHEIDAREERQTFGSVSIGTKLYFLTQRYTNIVGFPTFSYPPI